MAHIFGWGPWRTDEMELEEFFYWSDEAVKTLETMNG